MIYSEILIKVKQGKLQNFEEIFRWNYGKEKLVFNNKDFQCDAKGLDILNRSDFYYTI